MNPLEIRVFISGFNDRRCEVLLRKEVPAKIQENPALLDGWAQKITMAIGYDMKHTQRWDCETCGKPARETWFHPRPSLRPPEPLVVLHIHHLCEAGGGPCHMAVENRARELAIAAGGMLPPPSLHLPKPSGPAIPLASGCAKCQRDETGAPGSTISRCSRCKLTRYCSVECQTEDWPRHGKICKTVKEVKWINWEDNNAHAEPAIVPQRMPEITLSFLCKLLPTAAVLFAGILLFQKN
ncbi:hypothetical protein DFH08DRAFT_848993 [Mycena albidolilacea]|uniref:MYND-type domain-containing protein n=1 Tax=Mycena albidolilacea TaxID=1033008 RepID=A0AAD7EYK8_9AGAR|nr:hypothetical protein DFH08DRAFT_848993 [Mycena albidolilacea]